MTQKELKQIAYLKSEIRMDTERLQSLRSAGGMPSARLRVRVQGGPGGDIVADYVAQADALERLIEENRRRCMAQLVYVQHFINSVDDSLVRQILCARYIKCRTWTRIAFDIGEYDEQVPRRIHDRFLRRSGIPRE